jgi:hypothetical protein
LLDLWFDGSALLTALSPSKGKLTILNEVEGSSLVSPITAFVPPQAGLKRYEFGNYKLTPFWQIVILNK